MGLLWAQVNKLREDNRGQPQHPAMVDGIRRATNGDYALDNAGFAAQDTAQLWGGVGINSPRVVLNVLR